MEKVEGKKNRHTISTEHKNQAAVFYRKAIIHFVALPLAVKVGSLLLNSLLVRMTTILKMGICDTLKKNDAVIVSSYHRHLNKCSLYMWTNKLQQAQKGEGERASSHGVN